MKREIKDVYTGFVTTITFGPFPGTGSNLTVLPSTIFSSLTNAGIITKAISYRIANIPGTDFFQAAVQFLVCPGDLQRVQALIGNPGVLSGPLSGYPALSPVIGAIPATTPVTFAFQEAVIIGTCRTPSYELRQRLLAYITASGFTVNNFSLLGNNIILTGLPRDISPYNDAKLIIGSFLPLLGIDCSKFGEKFIHEIEKGNCEESRSVERCHQKRKHRNKYD